MNQTVIAIFNKGTEAETAVKQLLHEGYLKQNIDISEEGIDDYSSSSSGKFYKDDGDSIGSFFRYMFGTGSKVRDFSDVARRGCVVTVHVESKHDAERAADILDLFGAVDVNEKASYYRNYEHHEKVTVGVESESNRSKSMIIEKPVKEDLRLRSERDDL